MRELFRVKWNCLANKADTTIGESHVIRRRKLVDRLKLLVEMLSYGRVCTISTNEDVAVISRIVSASDHDLVPVLFAREDPLSKDNAILGNVAEEQIIELGSRDDILRIATTVMKVQRYGD